MPQLPLSTTIVALCACLSTGSALAAPVAGRQMPIDTVPPLLADDGSAYPCAQRMAAAEAATQGPPPGCATQAQRDQLLRLHPNRVVRIATDGQGAGPAQTPARDAWVFVEGPGTGAFRLARRFVAEGVGQVWVLLPEPVAATPAPPAQVVKRSQP